MDRTKELEVIAAIIDDDRSRRGRKRAAEKVAGEILDALNGVLAPPVALEEAEQTKLAKACSHPTRVGILTLLADPKVLKSEDEGLSPTALATKLDAPLGQVSYHVRGLAANGLIELLRTEPRRGALEHFYGISASGHMALALVGPRRLRAA